jgi:hypothetical protein
MFALPPKADVRRARSKVQHIQEGRMSPERKARLDALGFVWDALADQWEEGFEHLQAYVSEHGYCRLPHKHMCADGYRLGAWVNKQRQKQDGMPAEQKARLDALGFVWASQVLTRSIDSAAVSAGG